MNIMRLFPIAVITFAGGLVSPAGGQTPGKPAPPAPAGVPMEAEVLRATTARQIDASGLASKPFPVRPGARFDLVSQDLADVTLSRKGIKIKLPKADVRIYEKDLTALPEPTRSDRDSRVPPAVRAKEQAAADAAAAAEAAKAAFVPGGDLVIVSAKYSLIGNPPRNVKSKVEKMIPTGPLSALVSILVSDQLSRAAANQGSFVVVQSQTTTSVVELPKSVLTVVYTYNGRTLTKQGKEGTTLYLP